MKLSSRSAAYLVQMPFRLAAVEDNTNSRFGKFQNTRRIDRRDRKCPCDVVKTGSNKRFGLIESRNSDSPGSQFLLLPRNLQTFVRFDMRPESDPQRFGAILHRL